MKHCILLKSFRVSVIHTRMNQIEIEISLILSRIVEKEMLFKKT